MADPCVCHTQRGPRPFCARFRPEAFRREVDRVRGEILATGHLRFTDEINGARVDLRVPVPRVAR